ncbi:MAG TPA: MASE1 domain-containing protein, partial [Gemmatimonadaceae bacterium]
MEPVLAPQRVDTVREVAPARPNRPADSRSTVRFVIALILLAAIYTAAARAGLVLDAIAGFATLVWAPTGISIAALLLFGFRLWPAIFVGAFVANSLTGASVVAALGIACGNTLEAVVATAILARTPGFRLGLDRLEDVARFIVLGAVLSTAISATVGVSTLFLAGTITTSQIAITWRAWWLGDLVGALVVAPMLLVWLSQRSLSSQRQQITEGVVLLLALISVCVYIFGGDTSGRHSPEQTYLVFPALIFAALRFGQRGAVTAVFVTTVAAVWGTVSGHGPFARPVLNEGLFALQTFIAIATATFLVLGASVAEQRRTEDWLRRARELAEAANHAKSDFLAVMSRELRTPLNAISGYVDLLDMQVAGPVTDTQRNYLSRIQSSQRHLHSLLEDVLGFARLESGRLALSPQPVIVYDAIATLESMLQVELQKKRLTFDCRMADNRLVALADPDKLRQILLNLVANGVKFTPEGGRITVGAERDENRIRLWVTDTGIGIPSDQLESVFEPFFQVDHGVARKYPGMGLGLAIARDLARAMNGELWMESTVGAGST